MIIRHATPADIDVIMSCVDIARSFMRAHGNALQWIKGYPSRELYLDDMAQGNCYVAEQDGEVHGVFTMMEGPDPTYGKIEDGAWPSDAPYAVIHRIASDGKVKGVLQAAVDYTAERYDVIRADTHKVNIPMQNALSKCGFVRCGVIYIDDGTPREAYQRG